VGRREAREKGRVENVGEGREQGKEYLQNLILSFGCAPTSIQFVLHNFVVSMFFAADLSNRVTEDVKDLFHVDQFVSHTDVEFDDLSPQVIRAYIETGEPMYVFMSWWQLV